MIQNISPLAIKICQILKNNHFQAYIVGGCVRDLILNIKPHDFDICTDAQPQQIIDLFDKTIPIGMQHGTVTVVLENELFEVTTFRTEGKYSDGRRPDRVNFVSDINEDLSRRDFTINSLAFDPITQELKDPFHGQKDLQDQIIKCVGDPNLRFKEDGLRIMRAARFAARFNFKIENNTFQGMQNNLDTLKMVSKERIKDELHKTLISKHYQYGIKIFQESGILDLICPLLAGRQLPQLDSQSDDKNASTSPLEAGIRLPARLAWLYQKLNICNIEKELVNLKFSNKEIKETIFLLKSLEKLLIVKENNNLINYKILICFIKNHETNYQETLCDLKWLDHDFSDIMEQYKNEIIYSRKELKIDGDCLMGLGIAQGPKIKQCLDLCYQHILSYPERNSKDKLINYLVNNYSLWK